MFILLLFVAVSRQATAQQNDCNGTGGGGEIVIEMYDNNGPASPAPPNQTMRIHKIDGTLIYPTLPGETGVITSRTGCDWVGGVSGGTSGLDFECTLGDSRCNSQAYVLTIGGKAYFYAPTNPINVEEGSFFFPLATGSHDVGFSIHYDHSTHTKTVRAREDSPSMTGVHYEDLLGSNYVIPYNLDFFCSNPSTPSCGQTPTAGYVLAPITSSFCEPPPDFESLNNLSPIDPVFTFSDQADVIIPSGWPDQDWDYSGLELRFPGDISLEARLPFASSSALYTDKVSGYVPNTCEPICSGWSGILVKGNDGQVNFDGVVVEHADVGIEIRTDNDNVIANSRFDQNGIGILADHVNAGLEAQRSRFLLQESCVTNSEFVLNGSQGYGIWARSTNADIESATVEGNGGYGLFVDNADVDAFDMLVTENGASSSSAMDGVRSGANGDLILSSYFSTCSSESFGSGNVCGSGENAIRHNERDELSIQASGYANVGDICGIASCPGVNRISDGTTFNANNRLIGNESSTTTISAERTYWYDTATTPADPPNTAFDNPARVEDVPASSANNPLPDAGADLVCNSLSEMTGPAATQAARSVAAYRGGEPTIDPEDAAWLRARMQRLRQSLERNPASDSALTVLSRLHRLQRLDRTDLLGERINTTGLLTSLRLHVLNPLASPRMRAVGEAAFVMTVHDALRDDDPITARAMLLALTPHIQGEAAQRSAELAHATLDELERDSPSAITRMARVLAGLGEGDESLANDLIATISLLERRMGQTPEVRDFNPTHELAANADGKTGPGVGFVLQEAYPNPFNPVAVVPFELTDPGLVRIGVYDLLGRRVAVLVNGQVEAGRHEATFDGSELPSGSYLIRASVQPENEAAMRTFTQRITLLK